MRKFYRTRNTTEDHDFMEDIGGDTSMQFALVVGAVAVAAALLVPLMFQGNTQLASSYHTQIDKTVTGSIGPVKRYRVRKSILDNID